MNYFVLESNTNDEFVYVSDIPEQIEDQFELVQGVSRFATWPETVYLEFSSYRADGLRLTDHIANCLGWLITSKQLQEAVVKFDPPAVEFLPVAIKNHKGRIASDKYSIANFTVLLEAVDRERSEFEIDALNENNISDFDELVLLDSVVEAGPAVFRLKERSMTILFREDLVEAIDAAGLTGMVFTNTQDYVS